MVKPTEVNVVTVRSEILDSAWLALPGLFWVWLLIITQRQSRRVLGVPVALDDQKAQLFSFDPTPKPKGPRATETSPTTT